MSEIVERGVWWAHVTGTKLTYVGKAADGALVIGQRDLTTHQNVWRDTVTVAGAAGVTGASAWAEPNGDVYIGGAARYPGRSEGLVAAYAAGGTQRWLETFGEDCSCNQCFLEVLSIEMTPGNRLRLGGRLLHRAVMSPDGALLDFIPACSSGGRCDYADLIAWHPDGCRLTASGLALVAEVASCRHDGLVGAGAHGHGVSLPFTRQLRGVGNAVEVLAERQASRTWARLTFAPCHASDIPPCSDFDVCTIDTPAGGQCSWDFTPSDDCGLCAPYGDCDDGDPCTYDRCYPFGDGCVNTPKANCP